MVYTLNIQYEHKLTYCAADIMQTAQSVYYKHCVCLFDNVCGHRPTCLGQWGGERASGAYVSDNVIVNKGPI